MEKRLHNILFDIGFISERAQTKQVNQVRFGKGRPQMSIPDKIQLIAHIGMGKTGSSSIQRALNGSRETLTDQGAEYLGMWFDAIDPDFRGEVGQKAFFNASAAAQPELARKFVEHLRTRNRESGASKFLISNESLFTLARKLTPFFSTLQDSVNLKLVAYVRNPNEWLSSAYAQWGLFHKTSGGKFKGYAELAPRLLRTFGGAKEWYDAFGDHLDIQEYKSGTNIVDDFASVVGLKLEYDGLRMLERASDAELLFRSAYNAQFDREVFPKEFNQAFKSVDLRRPPSLLDMYNAAFEETTSADLASEELPVFEFLKEIYGIDFVTEPQINPNDRNKSDVHWQISDINSRIIFDLSQKVSDLTNRLSKLESGTSSSPVKVTPKTNQESAAVPDKPHMDEGGRNLFETHIEGVNCYLEYGCGGSTRYALEQAKVPFVISIDTDESWVKAVRNIRIEHEGKLFINYCDIGEVGAWGVPVDNSRSSEYWKYICHPWRVVRNNELQPELVLVDGRFRVACLLYTMLSCSEGTKILMDDYTDRPVYHQIEQFFTPLEVSGRMALFQKSKIDDMSKLVESVLRYSQVSK